MSQIETLRALTQRENEKRLERLASQIESVRQAKHQSAEDLAATLKPLAQAMAALVDETRQTLAQIEAKSQQQATQFSEHLSEIAQNWNQAAEEAQKAADRLDRAGQRMDWIHYGLTVLTGIITAVLVTVFWLWLAPLPKIQLDPEAIANHLKPALTGQSTPSSGKPKR